MTDPDPDNPKEMHPLSLFNFLLKKNLQVKLLILFGQKLLVMLISTTQHMIH